MADPEQALVDGIRAASRQMVRELGFMQATLAATDYPASAVHALIELGKHGSMSAAAIAACLGLDKSSVSRMLRKLVDAGELTETVSDHDGRIKNLSLTARGRRTLAAVEAYGRRQVGEALQHMAPEARGLVHAGLEAYARALVQARSGAAGAVISRVRVCPGYRVGVIGRVTEMHGLFYARHAGFGQYFESQVATGLAEFCGRLERPGNGLWVALQGERIVGSVAIDGEDLGPGLAHLRWFIVDGAVRGGGVGQRLLQAALAHCDGYGFAETRLWTFAGLEAARHLYEAWGFVLGEERQGRQWGETVTEQLFVRPGVAG